MSLRFSVSGTVSLRSPFKMFLMLKLGSMKVGGIMTPLASSSGGAVCTSGPRPTGLVSRLSGLEVDEEEGVRFEFSEGV